MKMSFYVADDTIVRFIEKALCVKEVHEMRALLGDMLDVWPKSIRLDVALGARGSGDLDLAPYRTLNGSGEVVLDLDGLSDDVAASAHKPLIGWHERDEMRALLHGYQASAGMPAADIPAVARQGA